ncbi:hypothetical protein V6B08_17580 [Ferrovibrio sp. MS7]|uniref:hypothetical protein n=1 Tax=Ferrovibrio plantarum TaxID=3119164 RepID=UPI003135531D
MLKKPFPDAAPEVPLSPSLARWEGEGGASNELSTLSEQDRRVLECLGAAVVNGWNDLPTTVRRAIFRNAVAEATYDPMLLVPQIARFLHDHKDDTGAA